MSIKICRQLLYSFILLILGSVTNSMANEPTTQELPLIESTNVEALYSDEGIVVAKLTTEKQLQYKNGDKVFPLGIYVECYDKEKNLTATLRANTVYQYADTDVWELKGDVEVKGYQDGRETQLNTEELYWNLKNKEIYTFKFVRVETEYELLTGYGLNAKQDLSYYVISAPQGFVNIDSKQIE